MNFTPELDLEHYLNILRRRRWVVLLFTAATVLTVAFSLWLTDHVFKARATVLIDTEPANILEVQEVVSLGEGNYWSYKEYLKTQIEILKSREIAENVFVKLNVPAVLEKREDRLGNSDSLRSLLQRQIETLSVRFKKSLSLFRKYQPAAGSAAEKKEGRSIYESQLGHFRDKIGVRPIRETRLVQISFEDVSSEFAARAANTLARTYIQKNLNKRTSGAKDARAWLQEEYQKLSTKLAEAENTLQAFRRRNNFFSEDERREIINKNLVALNQELAQAEARLAEYRKRYREKHPTMQQTLYLVESLREKIGKTRAEAIAFEEKMIEYNSLVRDVRFTQRLLENVLSREKEALISSSLGTNNIFLVEEAVPPLYPDKPRKKVIVIMALFGGLLGGVLLAFVVEALQNTVQLPEDFTRHNVPFLGFVPTIRQSFLSKDDFADAYLMMNQKGVISELFNSLRTSVLLSSQKDNEWKTKSLLVTSFLPGEGKTLIACNLAVALARFHYKVLLVEADVRKPRINKIFQLQTDKGLSSYLVDNAPLEAIIQPSKQKDLDVMVCGPYPDQPSEILGSDRMKVLKSELEKSYDMVIYDSPPVFAVTDPVLLAQIIGSVMIVAKKNATPKKLIPGMMDKMESADAEIIGAVINHVREKEQGSGYSYRAYGEYAADKK